MPASAGWAPSGFAAIPTAAIDPPLGAASPAVPALMGPGPRQFNAALALAQAATDLPPAAALSLRKKNDGSRRNAKMDGYALHAWCLHVLAQGRSKELAKRYRRGSVTPAFLTEVVCLSTRSDGPRAAQALLAEHGVALVIARHLPRTHLDGAVMMAPEVHPVIGMTLRHDRLDNFWFCLLHELAHIGRHLGSDSSAVFVDDLDLAASDDDSKEIEADEWAREASIPHKAWVRHPVANSQTIHNVCALASELGISPAIVAGRVRRASNNYKRLSDMVGNGEVRKQFVQWK